MNGLDLILMFLVIAGVYGIAYAVDRYEQALEEEVAREWLAEVETWRKEFERLPEVGA